MGICGGDGADTAFFDSVFRAFVAGPEAQPGAIAKTGDVDDCNAVSRSILADAAGIYFARFAEFVGRWDHFGAGRNLAVVFRRATEATTAVTIG